MSRGNAQHAIFLMKDVVAVREMVKPESELGDEGNMKRKTNDFIINIYN